MFDDTPYVYRSPSQDPNECIDELDGLFQSVLAAKPSHLMICGDFNIAQVDWVSNHCSAHDSHFPNRFNTIQGCMLFQHVTQPTRFREGETPSLLDLIFTNEEGMLSGLEYLPGLGKSDHLMLRFCLRCYTTQADLNQRRLNFHKANFEKLRNMLNETNWECLSSLDIEAGYQFFWNKLASVVSACVPTSRSSKARKNIMLLAKHLDSKEKRSGCGTYT